MTAKDLIYATPNSVKPLYLINKINCYIEESNKNRILTLVLTDESKGTLTNSISDDGRKAKILLEK